MITGLGILIALILMSFVLWGDFNNDKVTALIAIAGLVWSVVNSIITHNKGEEYNGKLLAISDFADIYIYSKDAYITVANMSSYPVYLLGYKLNSEEEKSLNRCPLPCSLNGSYNIEVPAKIYYSRPSEIKFESYQGKKYISSFSGKYNGARWELHSEKRKAVQEC